MVYLHCITKCILWKGNITSTLVNMLYSLGHALGYIHSNVYMYIAGSFLSTCMGKYVLYTTSPLHTFTPELNLKKKSGLNQSIAL